MSPSLSASRTCRRGRLSRRAHAPARGACSRRGRLAARARSRAAALVDRRRRAGQRVGARRPSSGTRSRRGSSRVPCEQRDDPVEPVGDAAVRRRAVAKRLEQEAEALLGLVAASIPSAANTLLLHVGVGGCGSSRRRAPSRSRRRRRPRARRRPGRSGSSSPVGRGERMVERVPALLVLVPLEQRPVDDPAAARCASASDQVEALGQVAAAAAPSTRVGDRRLVGDDEQQVALRGAEARR